MKKKGKRFLLVLLTAVLLAVVAVFLYVNDYYHTEAEVEEYLLQHTGLQAGNVDGVVNIELSCIRDGLYLDGPGEDAALIFYPGAKVEYTAYVPLLYQLAAGGVDCFLIKMPCNLAFLGQNKAHAIIDVYSYEKWYLSGHSLGGAMAAIYAAGNIEKLDGLVLLAAYPTKDLKAEHFSVLSLYGSNDGVLNRKKLSEGRERMPVDYLEICIEGGNHAWFGNYGEQKGDGEALISKEEQQVQAVEAILAMIKEEE